MGDYYNRIERKLTDALAPEHLTIEDDSHRHVGHAGVHPDGGAETHFNVEIISQGFEGQNRVARQRQVYELLSDELRGRVHALSLVTLTPEEASKRRAG
ncbi:MAG: BolA family transcriptional regulator [Rhodospirillaceae bacterium]|nr:BolA family transcriptional regulator [Rhodospirillaceae bacterium]